MQGYVLTYNWIPYSVKGGKRRQTVLHMEGEMNKEIEVALKSFPLRPLGSVLARTERERPFRIVATLRLPVKSSVRFCLDGSVMPSTHPSDRILRRAVPIPFCWQTCSFVRWISSV